MCGRGTHGAAWRGGLSALVLCAGLADGCALLPPNSFIDPTKVGRFGLESGEGGIRRVLTPRDTPPGLAQATEPTPEDLAATYDDYRLAPGDALGVSIEDLIDYGRPFQMALEVSTLGEVRIPQLGSVRAAGLTERELEQELTARLKEAGVLPRPVVVVATQVKRGRLFTVLGAVRVPGPYPISDPELRLLDALGMVGDADANAKKLYVVRRSGGGKALAPEAVPSAMPKEELIIPPPVDQDAPPGRSEPRPSGSGGLMTGVGLALQTEQDPGTQPSPTKDELREVIAPGGPKTQPATRAVPERPKAQFEPLIFDPATGRVIEPEPKAAPPEAKAAEPKAPPSPHSVSIVRGTRVAKCAGSASVRTPAMEAGFPYHRIAATRYAASPSMRTSGSLTRGFASPNRRWSTNLPRGLRVANSASNSSTQMSVQAGVPASASPNSAW